MAKGVTPECRYGHGALKPVEVPQKAGLLEGAAPTSFAAIWINNQRLDFAGAYGFEIWRCSECSYLELHDDSVD